MERPKKEMADKGPPAGTGVSSLAIAGGSQGPLHTVRKKAMQVMEGETKTFARLASYDKEVNPPHSRNP